MAGARTHMIRSHRLRRSYKPTNKTIQNRAAAKRRQISRTLRGTPAAGLQIGGSYENNHHRRRGLLGWLAFWLDILRGLIGKCLG